MSRDKMGLTSLQERPHMCYAYCVNAQRIARGARPPAHERRSMFDEWLRLFWNSFLWWLPGAEDNGRTSHGAETQAAKSAESPSTARTGSGGAGGEPAADPAEAAPAPGGTADTARQAKGATGDQAKGQTASSTGAGQSGARATGAGTSSAPAERQGTATSDSAKGGGDDLTAIKGIGPKVANTLHAIGITSYADLAKADPAEVAAQVNQRPVTAKRVQDWIAEAKSRLG